MKKLLIIIAAVGVLGLAGLTAGGALTWAQEGEGPIETFLGKVAEKLGVGEDELKTAVQEAQIEMIDEAVAEGRLTEEQAERLKERVEEGGFLFPRHGPKDGRLMKGARLVAEASAQVLNMPREELVQQVKDGNSLAEVAEAQGMSVEDFKGALLDQVQTQLDDLVAEGRITQEQAERIFQGIEENIDRIVNAHPRPCRLGGPRPSPGGFPGGFGEPEPGLSEPAEVPTL